MDNNYLYAKNRYDVKYQFLIKKRETTDVKYSNDSKAFIEYLNDMDDIIKTMKNAIQIKIVRY